MGGAPDSNSALKGWGSRRPRKKVSLEMARLGNVLSSRQVDCSKFTYSVSLCLLPCWKSDQGRSDVLNPAKAVFLVPGLLWLQKQQD